MTTTMLQLKALKEKRNDMVEQMNAINNRALDELRAFDEAENTELERLDGEVKALDATIGRIESQRAMLAVPDDVAADTQEAAEVRAFAGYIRTGATGGVIQRADEAGTTVPADVNMAVGSDGTNGAVIPVTIANRIVKRIYDISPILGASTKYTVKGQLDLPYYDEETSSVNVAYAEEFASLVASSGKFKKISLTGYLAGALAKISRSMMNATDVALVEFLVNDISEKAARWIERELLNGTTGKIQGLAGVKQTVTAAATSAITLDELIDLQDAVPDQLQHGAMWIMNRKTRSLARKLKDGDGRPLLQYDVTSPFGHVILGHNVATSDNMAAPGAGKTGIYYGDMSGLAVKFAEQPTIEIAREKFLEQHAIGAFCWLEADAKVQVEQAIAQLKFKAS